MGDAAIQRLMDILQQLLAAQQQNAPPAQNASQLPTLPDVECFDASQHRGCEIEDWLKRFEFALDCAAPNFQDELKVKLLMTKLCGPTFSEYCKSVLPREVTDFDFVETSEKLKALFSRPQSSGLTDFGTFINRQKKLLRDFNFKKLNEEQFNCMVLLISLKSPKDATLRSRILAKLAADGDTVKYDTVVDDLKIYMSTIAEAKALEQPHVSKHLLAAKLKGQKKRKNSDHSSNASSMSTGTRSSNRSQRECWRCGGKHSSRECRHQETVCRKCKRNGHLERMCAKHQAWLKKNGGKKEKAVNNIRVGGVFLVKDENQRMKGMIEVPIDVDGTNVDFIADFGTEGTVLREDTVRKIGALKLSRCEERALYHDGTTRPFVGKGNATFSFGNRSAVGHFFVSKDGSKNLLGMDMMDRLGLSDSIRNVEREEILRKNRRGKKLKFFAVGANVIASSGDQPWRAGRVISQKGGTYDVQFLDGTTGEFPAKSVQPYMPDEDENFNFLDGFGLKSASSGAPVGKQQIGSDGRRDQMKDDLRASDCGQEA
ncbi:hypothetical protein niasHT_000668 [Heterodera trifolii]|uniref:CCHC-type domain-containing protein n=1 Tax=Heterodera trifolii TaxID=157864 RepID=A0ABD2MCK2_9BILA